VSECCIFAKHMLLRYSFFFVFFFCCNKCSLYLKVPWPFFQGKGTFDCCFLQLFACSSSTRSDFSLEKLSFLFLFLLIFRLALEKPFGWLFRKIWAFIEVWRYIWLPCFAIFLRRFFHGKTSRTHLKLCFLLPFFFSFSEID